MVTDADVMAPWRGRLASSLALTLDDYRRLEAEGKITRPLTDSPIGQSTAGRRNVEALNSQAVTRTLEPVARPRVDGEAASGPVGPRKPQSGTNTAPRPEIPTQPQEPT